MKVPILRVPFSDQDRAFVHQSIDEILDSGFLTMGPFTEEFERGFANFSGSVHGISCNSGTAALELILRGLHIRGKSVIVPTNTFLATGFAVMNAGNRIIFCDSRPETFSLDIDDVESRIDEDTAAVITVHIGGVMDPEIGRLKSLCDDRAIHLIEDCAHAHGCRLDDRAAGTIGVAGAFSFFPTKVLVTGEGGMVTTSDEELHQEIVKIRNHGKDRQLGNRMSAVGNNCRISETTAVLGVQQTRAAEAIIRSRQEIAAYYDEALGPVAGIQPLKLPDNLSSSYYKYIVMLEDGVERSTLKKRLKEEFEVSLTGEVYADLCHTEPLWDNCGLDGTPGKETAAAEGFPGATYLADNHVCLPLYPGLSQAERSWVVESITKALS